VSDCKPVRPFRHINCSSPGYQGEFLENRGVPFEIACIGAQMIARALGGNVSSGYRLEVGWNGSEPESDLHTLARMV
jgi:hypothetical protein